MDKVKYLIIGGGVAGTTAAQEIRKNDPQGSITIISKENHNLYSRISLPLFIKGKIPEERLFLKDGKFYKDSGITLISGVEVKSVAAKNKNVSLDNGEEIEFEELLIASGGTPRKWDIPGGDLKDIYRMHTIKDARKIRSALQAINCKLPPVVIGGGFISLELCEILVGAGLAPEIIILEDYYWQHILDGTAGKLVQKILNKNGVKISTNTKVEEVEKVDGRLSIRISNTKNTMSTLRPQLTDFLGVGIGIIPNMSFLEESGIKTNQGVMTDEYLETNVPQIYAAGDVAEFKDTAAGITHKLGNWSSALLQGRVSGSNMSLHGKKPFEEISSYTLKVFDSTISFIGNLNKSDKTRLISRGSSKGGMYGQLHLEEGRVIGAATINLANEKGIITNFIKEKTNLSVHLNRIPKLSFNLNTVKP